MNKRKENKSIHMAEILGRVERLLGNNIQSNPYDVDSVLGIAFIKGWIRDMDDAIAKSQK
jgi:hypothetical protein